MCCLKMSQSGIILRHRKCDLPQAVVRRDVIDIVDQSVLVAIHCRHQLSHVISAQKILDWPLWPGIDSKFGPCLADRTYICLQR